VAPPISIVKDVLMVKAVLALAALTALAPAPRFHADLKSSVPARDAKVTSPASVTLTFTEEVMRAGTVIQLLHADSSVYARLVVKGTKDPATVTAQVAKPMPPGDYLIKWRTVAADDGHSSTGFVPFHVVPGQ
jgi:methionine-rich copper-binding protein CopC